MLATFASLFSKCVLTWEKAFDRVGYLIIIIQALSAFEVSEIMIQAI
jgi:hypothetical protein